ncbi:hypothetical protein [Pseudorhizobium flavum]|uniref:hypothetical protein n=1 Tax=Pseudorhizobium flavum TaxID=1335061 RepID=UPI00376FA758
MVDTNNFLDPAMMALLREQMLEAYGAEDFEVIDWVPVLWSGWECDTTMVHVRLLDGRDLLGMPDKVNDCGDLADFLRERCQEYLEIEGRTQQLLANFRSKQGGRDAV